MAEQPEQPLEAQVWRLDLGANINEEGITTFNVWAPYHLSLYLEVVGKGTYRMRQQERGYFTFAGENIGPGDLYTYVFENGLKRPDPVSRSLPHGVHGPTEVIDPNHFQWTDHAWEGIELRESIIYEVHIGTFSSKGNFEGVIDKLPHLKNLGVNCIEVMPVIQFPGRWNWGYDGASLYAPHRGYGGVEGFKYFVNACHNEGFAVSLDVVYNHLGPEGNYLAEFGPYLSGIYHTPWGKALNYDDNYSDEVRAFVMKNARHWILEYHIDMLRLDAIHGIYDVSASPMLPDLIEDIQKLSEPLGRKTHVIAESGQNDGRLLREKGVGGWEMCGMWHDDFHHAAHVALTKERETYYVDFVGLSDLEKALRQGFVYDGIYSPFRKRKHGNSFEGIAFDKLIAFLQNHDQTGNRPLGERLSVLISRERLKVAAVLTVMTPCVPMLFMGEEYGEKAPFEYFIDYSDEKLMRSIFEGRKREFHRSDMPFPGKESFDNSSLTWEQDEELLTLYQTLIALRKKHLPKPEIGAEDVQVYASDEKEWLAWEYLTENGEWVGVLIYLGEGKETLCMTLPFQKVGGSKPFITTQPVKRTASGEYEIPPDTALILL